VVSPAAFAAEPALARNADVGGEMSTWTPPAIGADGDVDVDVDVEIEVSESIPPDAVDDALAASPPVESPAAPREPAPSRTESESEERLVAAQPMAREPAPEAYAASEAEPTPAGPPVEARATTPSLPPEPEVASAVAPATAGAPAEAPPIEGLPHDSWSPPADAAAQVAPQILPELDGERELRELRELGASVPEDTSTTPEAAPASSRRPVESEEQLADMAFGPAAPQPPRHTPPPESGRLPAAPPDEFDDVDVTGVRSATALAKDDREPAAVPPETITAEASRPVLAATADVADVVGAAPKFAPKTFAELLDATLAL
jgi:hypothetical protein